MFTNHKNVPLVYLRARREGQNCADSGDRAQRLVSGRFLMKCFRCVKERGIYQPKSFLIRFLRVVLEKAHDVPMSVARHDQRRHVRMFEAEAVELGNVLMIEPVPDYPSFQELLAGMTGQHARCSRQSIQQVKTFFNFSFLVEPPLIIFMMTLLDLAVEGADSTKNAALVPCLALHPSPPATHRRGHRWLCSGFQHV
jgi:hypothetical protein